MKDSELEGKKEVFARFKVRTGVNSIGEITATMTLDQVKHLREAGIDVETCEKLESKYNIAIGCLVIHDGG